MSAEPHFPDCPCKCEEIRRCEAKKRSEPLYKVYRPPQSSSKLTPFTEFQSVGPPKPDLGDPGDIYIDLTPDSYMLYGKLTEGEWTKWPGPDRLMSALRHPANPDIILWCESRARKPDVGWHHGITWIMHGSTHEVISKALAKRFGTKVKRVLMREEEDEPEAVKPKKQRKAVTPALLEELTGLRRENARLAGENLALQIRLSSRSVCEIGVGTEERESTKSKAWIPPTPDAIYSTGNPYLKWTESRAWKPPLPSLSGASSDTLGSASEESRRVQMDTGFPTSALNHLAFLNHVGDAHLDPPDARMSPSSQSVTIPPTMQGPSITFLGILNTQLLTPEGNDRSLSSETTLAGVQAAVEDPLFGSKAILVNEQAVDAIRNTVKMDQPTSKLLQDLEPVDIVPESANQGDKSHIPDQSSSTAWFDGMGDEEIDSTHGRHGLDSSCSSPMQGDSEDMVNETSIKQEVIEEELPSDHLVLNEARLTLIFYQHTKSELICRLCMANSSPQICKFVNITSPSVLFRHCKEKHMDVCGLLVTIEEAEVENMVRELSASGWLGPENHPSLLNPSSTG